ncbi:MAG: molybdopterin-guanine dinucleotide biosynthesis protein B [Deltaproteobacteria bacterium]|nr:molybdopterin-guanine dinucleotide biosynthesis protein B [Deltaproteobacteria bacterium]
MNFNNRNLINQLKCKINMPQIISIVGKSGSGKTTLLEKLVAELKKRGYKIGTIKHASEGFDIDKKGKDSWRHKQAGADTVVVASAGQIAMVKNESYETLDDLEKYFPDMNIVITEGFKKENKPKIEVFRGEKHRKPLCPGDTNLIAFVTNTKQNLSVPIFGLEEIKELADFIENKYL